MRVFRILPSRQLIVATQAPPVAYGAGAATHRAGYTDQNAAQLCQWLNDRERGYPSLGRLAFHWKQKDQTP